MGERPAARRREITLTLTEHQARTAKNALNHVLNFSDGHFYADEKRLLIRLRDAMVDE